MTNTPRPIERFWRKRILGQSIGEHAQGQGIGDQPDMAAENGDVLAVVVLVEGTTTPVEYPVGLGIDRRTSDGQRSSEGVDDLSRVVDKAVLPCGVLEHRRRPGHLALGSPRGPQADHLPYRVGTFVAQPPGEQAAETPADNTDRHAITLVKSVQSVG